MFAEVRMTTQVPVAEVPPALREPAVPVRRGWWPC